VVGGVFYSVIYLIPQFLGLIAGYNAEQAGWVMLVSGVPAFLMMPMLPRLLGKVDFRIMVITGLMCFVVSCMLDIHLTALSVGHDFFWSQFIRGAGQMLVFMPLNQASMAAVSREEAGDAAGVYNMARNLGGSIGLAIIGTVIDRRNTFHVAAIRESLTTNSVLGQARLASNAAGWFARTGDMAYAKMRALGQLAAQIQQQAMVITFSEVFYLLGIALLLCIPLALLLKTPSYGAPAAAGH
jgi:DHA2 family multidrug resistance protein